MTTTAPPADVEAGDGAYRAWAQRRVLRALVFAQVFGGAGLAAGVSVGALIAKDLLSSTSGAGLPAALFTAGSAGAAATVGRLSQRRGRRFGLTAGYATGAIGGAVVVLAAVTENVPLLFVSLLVYGAGTATNLQCRYAGADLAEESRRGRAVSTVLVATAVGAVAGRTCWVSPAISPKRSDYPASAARSCSPPSSTPLPAWSSPCCCARIRSSPPVSSPCPP